MLMELRKTKREMWMPDVFSKAYQRTTPVGTCRPLILPPNRRKSHISLLKFKLALQATPIAVVLMAMKSNSFRLVYGRNVLRLVLFENSVLAIPMANIRSNKKPGKLRVSFHTIQLRQLNFAISPTLQELSFPSNLAARSNNDTLHVQPQPEWLRSGCSQGVPSSRFFERLQLRALFHLRWSNVWILPCSTRILLRERLVQRGLCSWRVLLLSTIVL